MNTKHTIFFHTCFKLNQQQKKWTPKIIYIFSLLLLLLGMIHGHAPQREQITIRVLLPVSPDLILVNLEDVKMRKKHLNRSIAQQTYRYRHVNTGYKNMECSYIYLNLGNSIEFFRGTGQLRKLLNTRILTYNGHFEYFVFLGCHGNPQKYCRPKIFTKNEHELFHVSVDIKKEDRVHSTCLSPTIGFLLLPISQSLLRFGGLDSTTTPHL